MPCKGEKIVSSWNMIICEPGEYSPEFRTHVIDNDCQVVTVLSHLQCQVSCIMTVNVIKLWLL